MLEISKHMFHQVLRLSSWSQADSHSELQHPSVTG
uniref:Uncharacterized protein n=1 Tax=Arundo donax TaxID=35708 RepID=A0A0A8ZYI2_ARUDO